jgi:uncharacterized HAD superfamily protein
MELAKAPAPRRVAVDVDGVLADLHERFLHLLNKDAAKARDATGVHYGPCTLDDITDWNVWRVLPLLKDAAERSGEEYASGLCWRYFDLAWLAPHKMDPIPGAVSAMRELSKRKEALEVEILTSRRMETAGDMMAWLSMQDIPASAVVILDAHAPHVDKSERQYDVYVDDSPKLAEKMAGHSGSTLLLFDKPYNQATYAPNVRRVGNWREPGSSWTATLEYFRTTGTQ